jgi:serine/threonine protein kinase
MYAVFEVGNNAWLALEHADGGDFFKVVTEGRLAPDRIVCWMQQLLQAVRFLHRHHIGHRDISIENILLHKGNLQLMDFGQAVKTHSDNGVPLRYFRGLGKDYCRAPERQVPTERLVKVLAPETSLPNKIAFVVTRQPAHYMCEVSLPSEATPLEECLAEPCGYRVPPADIFSCGVCLFVMIARMPPWRKTMLSDPHFAFANDKGIAMLLKAWKVECQPALRDLLQTMLQADPSMRPTAADCLSSQPFL